MASVSTSGSGYYGYEATKWLTSNSAVIAYPSPTTFFEIFFKMRPRATTAASRDPSHVTISAFNCYVTKVKNLNKFVPKCDCELNLPRGENELKKKARRSLSADPPPSIFARRENSSPRSPSKKFPVKPKIDDSIIRRK